VTRLHLATAVATLMVPLAASADETRAIVKETVELTGRLLAPLACPHAPHLVAFQRVHALEHLYVVDTRTGALTPIASTPPERGLTPRSVYDGQPDWMSTPDEEGRAWIVFSGAGEYNNRDVYLTYVGAETAWRLTSDPAKDLTPRFSPDGTRIVFVSVRSGSGDLYHIEKVDELREAILAGTPLPPEANVERLTDSEERDLTPAFDPTGRFVAYAQFGRSDLETTTEPNMGLAVVDLEHPDHDPVRLTFDAAQDTRPAWSPDGNRIAFYFSPHVEDPEVSIGVIEVVYQGDRPVVGRLVETGVGRALATNVVPTEDRGPAWAPGTAELHPATIAYVRTSTIAGKRSVIADVRGWEAGEPTFETELDPWAIRAPDGVAWIDPGAVAASAVTDDGYGVFRVAAPGPLRAGREPFPRTEIEGGSRFDNRWLIVAGGVVLALALLDDDGGGGEVGDIGEPPCPPEMDDC